MASLSALILAAGKGTRMKSTWPKVLHPVGGVPMIGRVARTVDSLKVKQKAVIVGHGGDLVRAFIQDEFPKTAFVTQKKLDGSGGAVRQALAWIKKQKGEVLILCGDAPLLSKKSLQDLLSLHRRQKNQVTVLSARVSSPKGYGRIVRHVNGTVEKIVEELDASPTEKKINEINTGTYVFDANALKKAIPRLKNKNAKKEYYLTDTLALIQEAGGKAGASVLKDPRECVGINSRQGLAEANGYHWALKNEALMAAGVTILDPKSTFIEEEVQIGPDTTIYPQTFIQGKTKIGSHCVIGPWANLRDMKVENEAKIQASFLESAIIRKGAKVGPFARVRPLADLGPGAVLGNFSEIKKSKIGSGSKINHLSYLGDAKVGKNVNIGAGTITCNYDGYHKFPTIIQDHAFIGSNANLIAPIAIGPRAIVGAGSSLSENVPAGALAVERAQSRILKGWADKRARQFKKKKK